MSTRTSCRVYSPSFGDPSLTSRLYWTEKDVLAYLAETTDDAYIKAVKLLQDRPRSDLSTEGLTAQYAKSANPPQMEFEGLRDSGDHKIQDVKELMKVPVIVMSDMTKSPPVLVVYAGMSICSSRNCH
jgi:protein SSD1